METIRRQDFRTANLEHCYEETVFSEANLRGLVEHLNIIIK